MRRGFVGAGGGDAGGAVEESRGAGVAYDSSAALLRGQLAEAERALRELREGRLHSMHAEGALRTQPKAVKAKDGLGGGMFANIAHPLPPDLTDADYEILASQPDPPPTQLRRLAEAVTLLLESRTIVSLGDHPLPGQMPWRNIQALLRNTWEPREEAIGIAQVLSERPWGTRLAAAVRERLIGGTVPVTRQGVQKADKRCTGLFDFVEAFAGRAGAPSEAALSPEDSLSSSAIAAFRRQESVELSQERLSASVAAQEKEVARLRRLLREAENANSRSPAPSRLRMKPLATRKSWDTQRQQLTELCSEDASTSASSPTSVDTSFEPVVPPQDYQPLGLVGCCKAVQYRLNDTSVPRLQEAVLAAMLSSLTQPRTKAKIRRILEITGFSEQREDPETALWRAEAVREWFVAAGVSEEMLRVTVSSSAGSRGARRVELRLLDNRGGDSSGGSDAAEATEKAAARGRIDPEAIRAHAEKYFSHTASSRALATPAVVVASSTLFEEEKPTSEETFTRDAGIASVAQNFIPKEPNVLTDETSRGQPLPPRPSPKASSELCNAMRRTLGRGVSSSRHNGTKAVAEAPTQPFVAPFAGQVPHLTEVQEDISASPRVTLAEEAVDGLRRLRIVFTSPGLDARDAELEVGTVAVKLASNSGSWAALEVSLPFAVQSTVATHSARFSRKNGTLTLRLDEAPGGP